MKHLLLPLSTCLLLACSGPTPSAGIPQKKDSPIAPAEKEARLAPHFFVQRLAPFSDPERNDEFKLQLQGGPHESATIRFTIRNAGGELIHEETFPAAYLLSSESVTDTTTAAREAAIAQRMETFFANEQFLRPAVKKGEELHGDEERQADWDEIRADPTAIGFAYLLGEEDGRRIAWSKKRKKVVRYYNCC